MDISPKREPQTTVEEVFGNMCQLGDTLSEETAKATELRLNAMATKAKQERESLEQDGRKQQAEVDPELKEAAQTGDFTLRSSIGQKWQRKCKPGAELHREYNALSTLEDCTNLRTASEPSSTKPTGASTAPIFEQQASPAPSQPEQAGQQTSMSKHSTAAPSQQEQTQQQHQESSTKPTGASAAAAPRKQHQANRSKHSPAALRQQEQA